MRSFLHSFKRRIHFIWRYIRGRTPWDSGIVPPEIVTWVETHESSGGAPGRALDLGCGTGTTSLYLARCGWDVVGVDFAPNAIRRARRKARRQTLAGQVRFLSADVSRPDLLRDAEPFDLVIDVGCLHSLSPDVDGLRAGYTANLIRMARPGASYLLYAFLPRVSRDGRRRMGITRDELLARLAPAFELLSYVTGQEATADDVASAWYVLRRTDQPHTAESPADSPSAAGAGGRV